MTGGQLLRFGAGLGSDARHTASAYAALRGEWVGRASVAARRRGDLLAAAAATVAQESAQVGAVLQRHSTDLSGLIEQEETLRAQAAAAGLSLTEAGVALAPGLRGLADAVEVAHAETARAALDAAWTELQDRTRDSRAAVQAVLTGSTDRLVAAAATLRLR